ncbi:hypothetical protein IU483_30120 [Streptomyces gardneri]|nr:hypothetical protein [Streptomyces gardneri]
MDTVTSTHELAMLFASVNNYQGAPRGVSEPLPTALASETLSLMSGVIPFRKNTTPTLSAEPMPTVTSEQIPGLLTAEWAAALADLSVEDCFFRMLGPHEVGRGCGFDTTFPGHEGEFIVWGSARDQCDGFGNRRKPVGGYMDRVSAAGHPPHGGGDRLTRSDKSVPRRLVSAGAHCCEGQGGPVYSGRGARDTGRSASCRSQAGKAMAAAR